MKKVIAVAGSDFHIHEWKAFNEGGRRTAHSLDQIRLASKLCKQYKCPFLFCGDLLHNPKDITNELNSKLALAFKTFFEDRKIPFLAISGNHDLSEINHRDRRSPSHLWGLNSTLKYFNCLDFEKYSMGKIDVWGIPYIHKNKDYPEILADIRSKFEAPKNILLIHTDLPKAVETSGVVVGTANNIPSVKRTFRGFDLVLSGHIHKPQELSSRVRMLGAWQQHSRKDSQCEMGYWLIHEDLSMTFVPIKVYPQFKVHEGETAPDNFHYYDLVEPKKKAKVHKSVEKLLTTESESLIEGWVSTQTKVPTKNRIALLKETLKETQWQQNSNP